MKAATWFPNFVFVLWFCSSFGGKGEQTAEQSATNGLKKWTVQCTLYMLEATKNPLKNYINGTERFFPCSNQQMLAMRVRWRKSAAQRDREGKRTRTTRKNWRKIIIIPFGYVYFAYPPNRYLVFSSRILRWEKKNYSVRRIKENKSRKKWK